MPTHSHDGHVHGPAQPSARLPGGAGDALAGRTAADRRSLRAALGLVVALLAVEVVAGILSGSLALLSDAAHLLTDAGALALALAAARLAQRPARGALTFGLGRVEILSAQVNGLTLGLLCLPVAVEAVRRLLDPPAVDAGPVLAVALGGVVVTLASVRVLGHHGEGPQSLNVEGARQHMATDLIGFAAAAAAAGIILVAGWRRADPIASLVVCGVMARSAYGLLRDAGRVFLEAAPAGVDPAVVGRALAAQAGVDEVHDLHVWELTAGFVALSAHVLVESGADCHAIRRALESVLRERFALEHTTLQVDHRPRGGLLSIQSPGPEQAPTPGSPLR